jgi:glycosyltransferase involved in cell wall biosynthesis
MSTPGGPGGERVSVVIPAFCAERTICRAVDSVLAQTHPPVEVIVIDDGSPDGQAGLIERTYGDRVRLLRKPNGGTASARNAGLDLVTGDYVAFLDADDHWEKERLARQLEAFASHPELSLIAGASFQELPGQPRARSVLRPGPRSWYGRPLEVRGTSAFCLATMIWTGMVLVRREALGSDRFVSGLEPAEDRDLWIRLTTRNRVYLLKEPLATAVLLEGSLSRSNLAKDKASMLRVVERHRRLLGPVWATMWRSHVLYGWAAVDPDPRSALPRLLKSLVLWPLPYVHVVRGVSFGRVKRLAILLRRATLRS